MGWHKAFGATVWQLAPRITRPWAVLTLDSGAGLSTRVSVVLSALPASGSLFIATLFSCISSLWLFP